MIEDYSTNYYDPNQNKKTNAPISFGSKFFNTAQLKFSNYKFTQKKGYSLYTKTVLSSSTHEYTLPLHICVLHRGNSLQSRSNEWGHPSLLTDTSSHQCRTGRTARFGIPRSNRLVKQHGFANHHGQIDLHAERIVPNRTMGVTGWPSSRFFLGVSDRGGETPSFIFLYPHQL